MVFVFSGFYFPSSIENEKEENRSSVCIDFGFSEVLASGGGGDSDSDSDDGKKKKKIGRRKGGGGSDARSFFLY